MADSLKPAPRRALVVDDYAPFRRLVARLLGAEGWTVREASSFEAALLAAREPADAIIVDWVLGEGPDGLELVRALRARPDLASVPIVLVSALRDGVHDESAALVAGASMFLAKPEIGASPAAFARHVEALVHSAGETLSLGQGFCLDLRNARLLGPSLERALSRQEALLLELLVRANGNVVEHRTLWQGVWESRSRDWRQTLHHRIWTLRDKLGPLGSGLICRRGLGFAFVRQG